MKSFTTEIKEELIDLDLTKEEDIAELSGFIRNNSSSLDKKIDIKNENMLVIKRMYTLFKKNFNILAKNYTEINKIFNKNHIYHLMIDQNLDFILKTLNIVDDNDNILEKISKYIGVNIDSVAYLKYDIEKRLKRDSVISSFKKSAKVKEEDLEYGIISGLEVLGDEKDRYNYRNKVSLKVKVGKDKENEEIAIFRILQKEKQ